MRKSILFVILALSFNAFAQSKRPTFAVQHPRLNSEEDIQVRMKDGGLKTSNICSGMNPGEAIKLQTHKQRELIQIYDSIFMWQWDTLSIGWKINLKIINIVYNANNNLTSELEQSWDGSTWVNSSKSTYTYDANNNLTSHLYQSWNGSTWVNSSKSTYTYNANNNLTSHLYQSWNGSTWVNFLQSTNTYDANNNLTSKLEQSWDGSTWVNIYQDTYTHDANNNLTSELGQSWNGSTWVNSSQSTYTYNANNNRTSKLRQSWNGSTWVNSSQSTYTYDANNNRTSELGQSWNGSTWVNFSQYTYTYDANNNWISELGQSWNGSTWVTHYQYTDTYDANNFEISYSYKHWNSAGTKVKNGDSTYKYFHTAVGINYLAAQEGNVTVYPNPSSGKVTIRSNSTISSIEIYNLFGERINADYKLNQPAPPAARQTSNEIDLSDLPKGIYFIKIYSGEKTRTEKIIVQ